jgi:hypothetical protein
MGLEIGWLKGRFVSFFQRCARIQMLAVALVLFAFPYIAAAGLYYNQQEGFSIDAPTGWTVKKSAMPHTIVKFVLRDSADRIAVLSIASHEETWLSSLIPLTADGMYDSFKDEFRDFTVHRIASGTTKIRSMDAVWNLFEITEPPQARIIGKHYHLRRNGRLYRISIQADSGKSFFNAILPTAEKSIATLAFGL